jgi:hypothetical protein
VSPGFAMYWFDTSHRAHQDARCSNSEAQPEVFLQDVRLSRAKTITGAAPAERIASDAWLQADTSDTRSRVVGCHC